MCSGLLENADTQPTREVREKRKRLVIVTLDRKTSKCNFAHSAVRSIEATKRCISTLGDFLT